LLDRLDPLENSLSLHVELLARHGPRSNETEMRCGERERAWPAKQMF
jgi:hypothetical protein